MSKIQLLLESPELQMMILGIQLPGLVEFKNRHAKQYWTFYCSLALSIGAYFFSICSTLNFILLYLLQVLCLGLGTMPAANCLVYLIQIMWKLTLHGLYSLLLLAYQVSMLVLLMQFNDNFRKTPEEHTCAREVNHCTGFDLGLQTVADT